MNITRASLKMALQLTGYLLLLVCAFLTVQLHWVRAETLLHVAPMALGVVILLVLLTRRNETLATVYVIYSFLILNIAYSIFVPNLATEGSALFLIVAFGYLLGRCTAGVEIPLHINLPLVYRSQREAAESGIYFIYAGITARMFSHLILLSQYGVRGFYSGGYMADKIGGYSSGNGGSGPISILSQFGAMLYVGGIAASEPIFKQHRRLVFFALVGVPVIVMQRGEVLAGAMCLIYFYRHLLKLRHLAIIASAVIFVALLFGGLRSQKMAGPASVEAGGPFGSFLGELSAAHAVHETVLTIQTDGMSYGATLFGPIVTAVIPRTLFAAKPELTAAVMQEKYDPGSAAAGFYLAVTLFGDWIYNFGYAGLAFISLLMGRVITKVDKSPRTSFGVVLSYYFYSLLRDGFPRPFATMALCMMICWLTRLEWNRPRPAASAS